MGDEYTLFLVLLRITEATRIPATLDRRLLATRELFDIAERLDEPVQLGFAAVRDIRTKFEAARFDQVGRPFAVLDAVSHLDPFVQHNHSSLRAVDAQFHGRLDDALAHAERARELGLSENDATAVYVSTTSMIRWDMGTLGEMLPVLERICRDFPGVVGFQPTAGLALVTVGEVDRAREILRAAADQRFAHLPLNPLWAMTVSVYSSLCVEVGDAVTAAVLHDLMAPLRGRANISVVSSNGLVTESLAALAVVAGRLDAAAADVAEALAQADLLDARISTARSTLTLARLHAAHGRDLDARAAALATCGMARELGMARLATQAEGLVRAADLERRGQALQRLLHVLAVVLGAIGHADHHAGQLGDHRVAMVVPVVRHQRRAVRRLQCETPAGHLRAGRLHVEGELLAGIGLGDDAERLPLLLAVVVGPLEAHAHRRAGGALQPLATVVLRRPLPHAGQVADERVQPLRRGRDDPGDFDLVAHGPYLNRSRDWSRSTGAIVALSSRSHW